MLYLYRRLSLVNRGCTLQPISSFRLIQQLRHLILPTLMKRRTLQSCLTLKHLPLLAARGRCSRRTLGSFRLDRLLTPLDELGRTLFVDLLQGIWVQQGPQVPMNKELNVLLPVNRDPGTLSSSCPCAQGDLLSHPRQLLSLEHRDR